MGYDEQEARTRLLAGVRHERAKPAAPPAFPAVISPGLSKKPEFPGAFPLIWMIPYPRNPYFTGREDLLTQLATALKSGTTTALTQAITGLGGIGKTHLAIEYAYQHHQDYQAVFWVRADTRENLVSDFASMARELQLPEKDAKELQQTVVAVQAWLRTHAGWLLILDNADDLALARDFLPPSYGGQVLLTTRAQAMGRLAQRIEVDTMPQEVGILFLLRRAGLLAPEGLLEQASPQDRKQADELVQELGGLPLALDQAGAYMEETPCSIDEYLRLYRTRRAALLKATWRPGQRSPGLGSHHLVARICLGGAGESAGSRSLAPVCIPSPGCHPGRPATQRIDRDWSLTYRNWEPTTWHFMKL